MLHICWRESDVESLLPSVSSVPPLSHLAATKLILGKIGIKKAIRERNPITFLGGLQMSLIEV